jgi:phosphoribosylaminoimidazole-succinocarboxamide synthase
MVQVLHEALIPELPNYQRGKVRDNYDLGDGVRVIITTDRLSAFDQPIADIPQKGRVLTQLAKYWFRHTTDIVPNHFLDSPDRNVLLCRQLDMLPVEVVVRDYLAGTTDTSILQMYKRGERSFYGYTLPDGLKDNDRLPQTMITPTTKSATHDAPLTGFDVVDQGLCSAEQWVEL